VTFALSRALQTAIFQRLKASPALTALVGPHIYDAMPPGPRPSLYVALGPETVRDRSDGTGRGADHDLAIAVVTDEAGFACAKDAAAAVADALIDADLLLSRGRLLWLLFLRAQAARKAGGEIRQIDLTFRARVEDDAAPQP
jgi:hypothetical protein